ncbi:MAG TPA: hypothetical protein VNH46_03035 [Gemmatimonadales bacterium]|nr:hypothetical protein [Gemmatimonadales bacterium]
MSLIHQLASFAAPWADFYNASKVAQSTVMFGHFGGIMTAGGLALAADRGTLRAARGEVSEQRRQLRELATVHPVVVGALAVTAVTGLLMFAADLENLAVSGVFWIKMGLVALLLANGWLMLRTERRLGAGQPSDGRDWGRLRVASLASLALWFAVMLAGSILPNVS